MAEGTEEVGSDFGFSYEKVVQIWRITEIVYRGILHN